MAFLISLNFLLDAKSVTCELYNIVYSTKYIVKQRSVTTPDGSGRLTVASNFFMNSGCYVDEQ